MENRFVLFFLKSEIKIKFHKKCNAVSEKNSYFAPVKTLK